MSEDIIYFELNNWDTDFYPDCEPFKTWMDLSDKDDFSIRDDNWVKEHKICVKWFLFDMSVNFLITAPRSFVEKECPALLEEKYKEFLRFPAEGQEVPKSEMLYDIPFLPYTEENIGKCVYVDGF